MKAKLVAVLLTSIVFALAAGTSPHAAARMLEGRVIAIADGDTIVVRAERERLTLRLVYVDAPELAQPYGRSARWALKKLIAHKRVRFQTFGQDKYDRTLALITRAEDNLEVNYEMVSRGHAWSYTRSELKKKYDDAEEKARASHLGLWRDSHPVRPATWRRNHKLKRQA